ncbi:MAG: acyl carrier protein [Candidatus Marinimicrobia bacterium]|jgi:acyl carrier protein|nr:acyl carrier protein [Candidatus Neomarinimicrobiota bacterium]
MMEKEKVEAKVKKTIAKVLKKEENEIASDANFIFDLGADSMQSLQLIAGFEEEFDIEMDEDGALEIQNVKDAVDFISEIVNK